MKKIKKGIKTVVLAVSLANIAMYLSAIAFAGGGAYVN